jgi:hypothetical protein
MCKVMIAAGVSDVENTIKFMHVMGDLMSTYNTDGLGYTAMTRTGKLFGKRWLNNDEAFTDGPKEHLVKAASRFPGMIDSSDLIEPIASEYGDTDWDNVTSVMLHTRMATSAKGLNNVHPFVTLDNKTALIHNGVIRNHTDFKLSLSTCDSEAILVSYLKNKVLTDPSNIQLTADELEGYYACGIMNTDNNTVDIFKRAANLWYSYVEELGTYVFTTDGNDIIKACESLGFTCEPPIEYKNAHFMRLDNVTGKMIKMYKLQAKPVVQPQYDYYGGDKYGSWSGAKTYNTPTIFSKPKGKIHKMTAAEVQEYIMMSGE